MTTMTYQIDTINKEVAIIKQNFPMKILELKSIITKMKNSLEVPISVLACQEYRSYRFVLTKG